MPHRKAPPVKHDDPEMAGERSRNAGGELRRKRGDTKVETIEDLYHVDFDVRGDMKLDSLREKLGEGSVAKLVRKAQSG